MSYLRIYTSEGRQPEAASLVGHLLRLSVIEYKQEIMNYMILRMRYVRIIFKNNTTIYMYVWVWFVY